MISVASSASEAVNQARLPVIGPPEKELTMDEKVHQEAKWHQEFHDVALANELVTQSNEFVPPPPSRLAEQISKCTEWAE